jgi:SAM-dependent methyltransferase
MNKQRQFWHEANRRSWNAVTPAHNSHKLNQADFLRNGGSTLFPEETELLGDLSGVRLAHLQCNCGQDSLSLANLGATVTGVDISDAAIEFAGALSEESGISARFLRADVYDWLDAAAERGETFDVVFCSYGAICWLSDLNRWAGGIAGILAPGGRFIAVEFHPVGMIFDQDWSPKYDAMSTSSPIEWQEGVNDYVSAAGAALSPSGFAEGVGDFVNPHECYEFVWSIGEILSALLSASLRIEQFAEYPYANGLRLWQDMREEEGRRMYPPASFPKIPLMFSVVAEKQAG